MPEHQEKSIVQSIERLSPSVYRLTLHAPLIAGEARPGQFAMVACGSTLDPLLRRPISIHQCSGDGRLQLVFKVVGRGTQLLSEIRAGQTLDLLGPLGRGFRLSPGPVALIGGGIGIAPLLFLAQALMQTGQADAPCRVLLGAQSGEDLAPLAAGFETLGCHVELATDDGSLGRHGLITDLLPAHLPNLGKVYACGPHPMMAAVAALCASAQVDCEVSLEAHMACGLGACLGCAAPGADGRYKHVCKHGPVFKAAEVAWTTR